MPSPFSLLALVGLLAAIPVVAANSDSFHIEEITIADLQQAILSKRITSTEIVKLYLARIKAFNGPAVEQPQGLLGPIKTMPHAKGIDALGTLNLRPAARKALGFDDHYARSMTDPVDSDPAMPDALEVAAELDRKFAETGKLVGPLHGVVIAIKDQFDTFDMRTTSGADVPYANDRPPRDSTFARKLREAGAIVLAKSNMGEYAGSYGGNRSSFGGTVVDAYDTERNPGGSSSGSSAAVAANLVTVAISEETGPSIRAPAQNNNTVGISGTQELVSRAGMMNIGINTRIGPTARTVADAARILTVIAGYDPRDEMTAFNVGRLPTQPYESFAHATSLKGMRVGVLREYMNPATLTKASLENIRIAEQAVEDLRKLGATIVDPGVDGLLTPYIRRYNPMLSNASFAKVNPELFPVDADGKPASDQIATLVGIAMDPSKGPAKQSLRDFPPALAAGESRYGFELYLAQRGDANIHTMADMLSKATYYNDGTPGSGKPTRLLATNAEMVLDTAVRLQRRFAVQQIVLQCMAELKLDAIVAPTGDTPPPKLIGPTGTGGGPTAGGRSGPLSGTTSNTWTLIGQQGFPAITVPGGFTKEVYDREFDRSAPPIPGADGRPAAPATHLVGPIPAHVPLGVDFNGRPFSEPILLTIASAYEQATHHRVQPPDFGPLPGRN